jgi:formylglycine-generating enzyme required for sulfatase activity
MTSWVRTGLGVVAAAGLFTAALPLREPVAEAQCNTACAKDAPRDAHGCCTAPPPSAASTGSCPAGTAAIPGGSYTLGERKDTVTVAPFCLDKTEVTAEAYAACVTSGACTAEGLNIHPECNYRVSGREKHPVNCVDWAQSDAYCRAQGRRLPTEEEWEWAARGATKATSYPWGQTAPDTQICWSGVTKRYGTCAVGSLPEGNSPQGVSDLAGNVWEWTSTTPSENANGRVYRGGSWFNDNASFMRASFRYWNLPANRNIVMGFRCAR